MRIKDITPSDDDQHKKLGRAIQVLRAARCRRPSVSGCRRPAGSKRWCVGRILPSLPTITTTPSRLNVIGAARLHQENPEEFAIPLCKEDSRHGGGFRGKVK